MPNNQRSFPTVANRLHHGFRGGSLGPSIAIGNVLSLAGLGSRHFGYVLDIGLAQASEHVGHRFRRLLGIYLLS